MLPSSAMGKGRVIAGIVAASAVLAGCGGSSDATKATSSSRPATTTTSTTTTTTVATTTTASAGTAEQALRRQFDYLSKGQAGKAYAELHPAQQTLITEAQYQCSVSQRPLEVTAVDVVDQYPERITVPGTTAQVDSTAITAKVSANGETFTDTYHEVQVGDRWVFTVADPSVPAACT